MHDLVLAGLDGSTFVGFMSALGVLEASYASRTEPNAPRLFWQHRGTWQPTLAGASSVQLLAEQILQDAQSQPVDDVLSFRYVKIEKNGAKPVGSLSPPLAVLRAALTSSLDRDRLRSDLLTALMCESWVESMKDDKAPSTEDLVRWGVPYDRGAPLDVAASPTPFDFTSRNVQFLDQVRRIRDILTLDTVVAELLHATGSPSDRIMRWDARVDMPGALFESSAPMTRPAAEWLAFRGLTLFPLIDCSGTARMSGFAGRRKSGEFNWILWERPLDREVIKSALSRRWDTIPESGRSAHGVTAAFTVSFRKDATGYDGTVSYSRPLPASGSAGVGVRGTWNRRQR